MKTRHHWHRWCGCFAASMLWLVAGSQSSAQWSLTQLNLPLIEDFASFTAPSTWATANPAANQLDSDIWALSQTSATGSVSSAFGLNYISGRGVSTGSTTTAGVYAFDTGSGVKGIGPQASDTEWSPGNLTVKLQNDTGLEIDMLRVEWSYLIYNDQSGRRFSQLLISDSDAAGSYVAPFGGEVISQDVPQNPLFWIVSPRDVLLNVSIPDGDEYYLRWSFADLAGFAGSGINRDKIAIADLRVTAVFPGDYNGDSVVDAADYVVWRKTGINGPTGYDTWRTNFGEPGGSGSVASANTTIPEPTTFVMLVVAAAGASTRRRQRTWRVSKLNNA